MRQAWKWAEGSVGCYHQTNTAIPLPLQYAVNEGKYDLTTKARRAVVGRNKQLDEGTGRPIWKCLDPLNCVTLGAFRKHDTVDANMDLEFSGYLHEPADPLTLVIGVSLGAMITQVRMVSKPANSEM